MHMVCLGCGVDLGPRPVPYDRCPIDGIYPAGWTFAWWFLGLPDPRTTELTLGLA